MPDLADMKLSERELGLILEFVDYVLDKPSLQSRDDHALLIEIIKKKPEIIPAVKSYIKEARYMHDLLNSAFSPPCLTSDAWRLTGS